MANQWPPHPTNPISTPPATGGPATTYTTLGIAVVVLGALLAGVLAVVTGALAFSNTSDALEVTEQPAQAPVFEPAFEEGADAFFPIADQLVAFEESTGEQVSAQEAATGLYGGTAENTCDPARLVEYLMSHPDKGHAWAQVQGITFEEIPDYINTLTVRVLAEDAVVLNHGFDQATGNPTQIETVLEAGTAVLVDANGDIRTRCYCGNPVTPKPIGHKPPRCVLLPGLIATTPGGSDKINATSSNVVATGMVTSDLGWTEIAWGPNGEFTGWTPTSNLSQHICVDPMPIIDPLPTPEPIIDPTPEPIIDPTPGQPFQPFCSISRTTMVVGERTEFSGGHVPDTVAVTWSFDHGDGYSERANPSLATYLDAGVYTVTGFADLGAGDVRSVPCGTVTVTPPTFTCHISDTEIPASDSTTITGTSSPSNLVVDWVFDHGNGASEAGNPSEAYYANPGTYDVTGHATYRGRTTTIECGTVEVLHSTFPIPVGHCPAEDFIGYLLGHAQQIADERQCAHRVHGGIGSTDYRPDRLNFVVGNSGYVHDVVYG